VSKPLHSSFTLFGELCSSGKSDRVGDVSHLLSSRVEITVAADEMPGREYF
jgi:hypothetical protein